MTQQDATRIANVIIGVAAVGAAWYVVRTPPLRRRAWSLATTALVTTLPAWFERELRQAWAESAAPRQKPRDMMSV